MTHKLMSLYLVLATSWTLIWLKFSVRTLKPVAFPLADTCTKIPQFCLMWYFVTHIVVFCFFNLHKKGGRALFYSSGLLDLQTLLNVTSPCGYMSRISFRGEKCVMKSAIILALSIMQLKDAYQSCNKAVKHYCFANILYFVLLFLCWN